MQETIDVLLGVPEVQVAVMNDDDGKYPANAPKCTKAWTGRYKDKDGEEYVICKDEHGYRVVLPGGNGFSHPFDDSWREVKSEHGLQGVTAHSYKCDESCP
jgi:hypothetical protein